MTEAIEATGPLVHPKIVEYDLITGIPPEFNEFLPKDCEEFKKWKSIQLGEVLEGRMEGLAVSDATSATPPASDGTASAPDKSGGGKKKKKDVPMIVLEKNVRNKKKCITTISGLDLFGVKLPEASKLFGKKFASGASVNKTADGKEQIDCQGDFLDQAVELILKQYTSIKKSDIYFIMDGKKSKERYFPDDDA